MQGTGGKDYGAKGAHGLFEKNLNLQISRQVQKILRIGTITKLL